MADVCTWNSNGTVDTLVGTSSYPDLTYYLIFGLMVVFFLLGYFTRKWYMEKKQEKQQEPKTEQKKTPKLQCDWCGKEFSSKKVFPPNAAVSCPDCSKQQVNKQ